MGGQMCVSRELWEDLSVDPAEQHLELGLMWKQEGHEGLSRGGHGPAQLLAGPLTFAESPGFSFCICEMGTMGNGALWESQLFQGAPKVNQLPLTLFVIYKTEIGFFTLTAVCLSTPNLCSLSPPGQHPVWHLPGLVHQTAPGQCERIGRKDS